MKDIKKTLVSLVVIGFGVCFLSLCIMWRMPYNSDHFLRNNLAGELDFLIVGASHGQCSMDTKIIDKGLGCNSYNLSYDGLSNHEKYYALKDDLKRNKIDTVVLELSYDTLQQQHITNFTDATLFTTFRIDKLFDRLSYFIKYAELDNKLFCYSVWMYHALTGNNVRTGVIEEANYETKGSRFLSSNDYRLTEDEVVADYNSRCFSVNSFNKQTIGYFKELVDLCHQYNTEVFIVVVPVSDNYIWRYDNLDSFEEWAKEFSNNNGAFFIDFNLLKNRYELFSDETCYSTDPVHMSEQGSHTFSKMFADVMKEYREGYEISNFFYESYDVMKKDSPYMVNYNNATANLVE